MTKKTRSFAGVLAILPLALGCSDARTGERGASAAADMLSESGALRVTLTSSPAALPVRGDNQVELAVSRVDDGEPVVELVLSLVPFMPVMGHGSPAVPSFSEQGDGRYRFDDVVLTMPGLWELRTKITGAVADAVTFSFDVK